jgi:methylmalonyl-CoA/ethylmalonyl-CoA epimerase
MNITRIEHIGIAVENLAVAIQYYEKILGLSCYAIEEVKDQKVKTAFFKVGDTKLELLEATDADSPIAKFIQKKGAGLHHLAFSVEGLAQSILEVEDKGVGLIDKEPRKGAEGLNIAFLHPKSTFGVLTEMCEPDLKP